MIYSECIWDSFFEIFIMKMTERTVLSPSPDMHYYLIWKEIMSESVLKAEITSEQLLTLAMDMGEKMITCGAEANRVEDTITRICMAYGCTRVDVFSITSFISASILTNDGHRETQSRRIYSYSHNLDLLEELNAVSRHICMHTPDYADIEKSIEHIHKSKPFKPHITIIGYMLSSGAFTVFFGGSLKDALVAMLISVIAYFIDVKFKPLGINMIMYNFFCTFLLGGLARYVNLTGFIDNLDKVFIGLVMLYIPGMQMTNSIRDILSGDIMSGLLRLIEAVILAIAIAVGFAASRFLLFGL